MAAIADPVEWAAYNEAGSRACCVCHKPVQQCGFLHWLKFEELPEARRDEWLRSTAPPLLLTFQVRFPRCLMDVDQRTAPALWG